MSAFATRSTAMQQLAAVCSRLAAPAPLLCAHLCLRWSVLRLTALSLSPPPFLRFPRAQAKVVWTKTVATRTSMWSTCHWCSGRSRMKFCWRRCTPSPWYAGACTQEGTRREGSAGSGIDARRTPDRCLSMHLIHSVLCAAPPPSLARASSPLFSPSSLSLSRPERVFRQRGSSRYLRLSIRSAFRSEIRHVGFERHADAAFRSRGCAHRDWNGSENQTGGHQDGAGSNCGARNDQRGFPGINPRCALRFLPLFSPLLHSLSVLLRPSLSSSPLAGDDARQRCSLSQHRATRHFHASSRSSPDSPPRLSLLFEILLSSLFLFSAAHALANCIHWAKTKQNIVQLSSLLAMTPAIDRRRELTGGVNRVSSILCAFLIPRFGAADDGRARILAHASGAHRACLRPSSPLRCQLCDCQ